MNANSLIAFPLKRILAWTGREVVSGSKFGYDAFLDIKRLAETWQQSIDVIFDVGANDGRTVRLVRKRFKDCRIVSFEPHPATFRQLSEHVKSIQKVEVINMALGPDECNKTMCRI